MEQGRTLTGSVVPVPELDPATIGAMFGLMDRYFLVDEAVFRSDLAGKDHVILLRDPDGAVQGFTSLRIITTVFHSRPVKALYSGDTIIDRAHWGTLELPRVWIPFMLRQVEDAGGVPFYWFLISSGYKTYRFLPVFFREFYPRHDVPMPDGIRGLREHLGRLLFGDRFDPATGTIELEHPTPLREGVVEDHQRRKDPHVTFFLATNPRHAEGGELACLTPLRRDNFRPATLRLLGL